MAQPDESLLDVAIALAPVVLGEHLDGLEEAALVFQLGRGGDAVSSCPWRAARCRHP